MERNAQSQYYARENHENQEKMWDNSLFWKFALDTNQL